MTTFQTPTFLAEVVSGGSVPLSGQPTTVGQRAYFQERLKARVYELIVNSFLNQCEANSSLTQASIARRLEKRPEQINRWLSGPSNLTLETVSDLVLGICGGEPSVAVLPLHSDMQTQTLDERQGVTRNSEAVDSASGASLKELARQLPETQGPKVDPFSRFEFPRLLDGGSTVRDLGLSGQITPANGNTPLLNERLHRIGVMWMSELKSTESPQNPGPGNVPIKTSPDFRVVYSNIFQYRLNVTDCSIVFSTLSDTGAEPYSLEQIKQVSVVMAFGQLKNLAEYLTMIVARYERDIGPINGVGGIPPADSELDSIFATLKAIGVHR
jgi:hypothetical protein